MKRQRLYMLTDDMKDFVWDAKHITSFVMDMGRQWKKTRARFYKNMPLGLLVMLDEIADLMVCEEGDCRELVHDGWDFCFDHGSRDMSEEEKKKQKRGKK